MKGLLSIVAGVLLLLPAISAAGQELDLHVSADSVTVGERFFVSVTVRHDFTADPQFPALDASDSLTFGDLEVRSLQALETFARDGGRIDSAVYEVTTFALDTAQIGPIPVLFTAGEDTFTVQTETEWLTVISLVPEDAEGVKDLAPLVDFPASRWPYVAAAAALLLLALLIALYLRRRRQLAALISAPPQPPVPPEREALDRLDALEHVDLSIPENIQPFYDELSGLLRTYVARRLHVPALESTTGELIRELRRRRLPAEETTNRLRGVLGTSDYVKFADASPPPSQGRELLGTSRSIVHDVEHELHPPEESESTDAPIVQ